MLANGHLEVVLEGMLKAFDDVSVDILRLVNTFFLSQTNEHGLINVCGNRATCFWRLSPSLIAIATLLQLRSQRRKHQNKRSLFK